MIDKNEVSRAVKQALVELYGDRIARLLLYGSYARGDARPDSDIDFLVILKDEKVRVGQEIRFMGATLSALDLQFGIHISSYPASLHSFEHSPLQFYQNVRTEGIPV